MFSRTLLISCSLLCFAAPAYAKEGPYITLSGAVDFLQDQTVEDPTPPPSTFEISYDNTYSGAVAVGYLFEPGLRFDIEARYQSIQGGEFRFSGGTIPVNAEDTDDFLVFTGNGYYDIDTGTIIVPYFGGGIGFTTLDADDVIFAAQAMVGVGLNITDTMMIYSGYRFFSTLNDLTDGPLTADALQSHSIDVGIRFSF